MTVKPIASVDPCLHVNVGNRWFDFGLSRFESGVWTQPMGSAPSTIHTMPTTPGRKPQSSLRGGEYLRFLDAPDVCGFKAPSVALNLMCPSKMSHHASVAFSEIGNTFYMIKDPLTGSPLLDSIGRRVGGGFEVVPGFVQILMTPLAGDVTGQTCTHLIVCRRHGDLYRNPWRQRTVRLWLGVRLCVLTTPLAGDVTRRTCSLNHSQTHDQIV